VSDDRARSFPQRVEALSASQRRALADALAAAGDMGTSERLVGFLALDRTNDGSPAPTDEALRAFLGERLPDYMIPSRFVLVDRLPRTAAGKLDRRALGRVEGTDLANDAGVRRSVAPRNAVEAKLVAIWKDVLKVSDVGVEDDFFEIGGDSLLSIRVIARAGREGIRISPERFFERPTIAHMAASAGAAGGPRSTVTSVRTPLDGSLGEAPLTPIQHWFLDAIPRHRDWWNQSYLLDLGHPLDAVQIEAVVRELVTHHAALRLRLVHRDGTWRQDFPPPNGSGCRVVDLGDVPEADRETRVAEECEREQASLRLERGRLFRCVAFLARAGWRRLFLVGHHVVLDNVSWSVILDDLATLVTQSARGESLRLSEPTAPARAWALALAELAATPHVASAAVHWLAMPADDGSLPPNVIREGMGDAASELAGCNDDADRLTVVLDAEDTRLLMHEMPRRMDASPQAVLLAALLLAWREWTGRDSLRLDLEGHGRDTLGTSLDVARTVGWFTTVFPVHLAVPHEPGNGNTPSHQALVHAARSVLESLPMRGAAHGLARWLAPDESLRAALAAHPRPALLFNLLGTHDLSLPPASGLRVTDEPHGRPRSPDGPRAYVIELNARVESGSLIVAIEYSRQALTAESMACFTAALRGALQAVAHGSSTPSAFPGVDASSLAIVAELLAELDDA
jgi:non-ribosomal peptide synthase protein (TIGR01720 family)